MIDQSNLYLYKNIHYIVLTEEVTGLGNTTERNVRKDKHDRSKYNTTGANITQARETFRKVTQAKQT